MKQSKIKSFAGALSVLLGVCALEADAEVIHVAEGESIADAIIAAKEGDTVQLAAGTWVLSSRIEIKKGVSLVGAGSDQTFLDGNWDGKTGNTGTGCKVLLLDHAKALVANLCIQNGYDKGTDDNGNGVGVRINSNGGTVSNCVIRGNYRGTRYRAAVGAYLNSTSALLTHCTICDNEEYYSGAADSDAPYGTGVMVVKGTVSDCTVTGNHANKYMARGAGVYLGSADAVVRNSFITNNWIQLERTGAGQRGGGVYVVDGLLENCLVMGNAIDAKTATGAKGGGLYQEGGKVVNCTFADNAAYAGGGVYVAGGAFVNNIVIGNEANASDETPDCFFADGVIVSHCCFAAGTAADIGTDCVFAKSGEVPFLSDYSIDPGSPCYDKGKDDECSSVADVFGNVRVQGEHIDIGCAEATPVSGLTISFEISQTEAYSTELVTFTGSAYGPGVTDENTTFVWTDDTGRELGRGKVLAVYLDPGTRSVTMTVTSGDETKFETKPDCIEVADGNVCVEVVATPTPPYNTPATAFTNILDAIAHAQDGMLISVGEGTFLEKDTLRLTRRVRLVGAGTDKTFVDATKFTTRANRTVTLNNAQAALSSLTVQNANANQYGAGIAIGANGGTVTNCVVRDCSISGGNAGWGAGIYMYGDLGRVTHSRIIGNSLPNASAHCGVGISMEGGVVSDCLIADNTSIATGTGITGGGVYASNGRIVNCTVVGNFAYQTGGISLEGNARAVNCIVYGNEAHSSIATPDFNLAASNKFMNCCFPAYAADTDLAVASPNLVFVADAPYGEGYELSAGSPCEDMGSDGICEDTADLFGAARVQGAAIDIGCAEATPSAEMVVNFAATPAVAIGSADVTLTAFVSGGGAKPELCTYEWTVGGETLAGRSVSIPLGIGRHGVSLKVTSQKGDVEEKSETQAVVVYPPEVRVETQANPAWPWDTAANAFTNLAEALEECLDGMTIRIGAGEYPVSQNIKVSKAVSVVGAGMEQTKLYRSIGGNMRVLTIDNVNAYVAELAVSGGRVSGTDHGGAIAFSEANGGVVEHCLITECEGTDAVSVMGSKSYLRRSIIRDNRCSGVKIWKGGKCESCLITENTANYGAGVVMTENSQGAGYLRNCTVIRNHGTSKAGTYSGAGVYAAGITANRYIYNCLIVDNTLASEVEDPPPGYPDAYYSSDVAHFDHCYAATEIGENCIFGVDPKVRASGKIPFASPCSRTGLYQSWMEGQLDLFGNPRVDAKAQAAGEPCVDIGCCQSIPIGLMLLVR